jgi:hypothetical protein
LAGGSGAVACGVGGGAGTAEGSRVINVVTACSLWGGGYRESIARID